MPLSSPVLGVHWGFRGDSILAAQGPGNVCLRDLAFSVSCFRYLLRSLGSTRHTNTKPLERVSRAWRAPVSEPLFSQTTFQSFSLLFFSAAAQLCLLVVEGNILISYSDFYLHARFRLFFPLTGHQHRDKSLVSQQQRRRVRLCFPAGTGGAWGKMWAARGADGVSEPARQPVTRLSRPCRPSGWAPSSPQWVPGPRRGLLTCRRCPRAAGADLPGGCSGKGPEGSGAHLTLGWGVILSVPKGALFVSTGNLYTVSIY